MIETPLAHPDPAARAAAARHGRWTGLWAIVGQALLIAACLFVYLRGWDRDLDVPLRFSADSLVAAMQSKSTIDNGWWWFNPRLGAPFGLDALQFPANANVDQALVWIVSRIIGNPIRAINLTWLTMVVLGGLGATWCLGRLGASRPSAVVAGTLFALTPFALYRNLGHFWMVTYLVPFVCTAALLVATGRIDRWHWGRAGLVWLVACLAVGFNYVYYAFFGCFVLLAAAAIGAIQHRLWRLLGAGVVGVAVIGGATAINLAPSLRSWETHGKPLIVHEKTAAESELYGLKIRQLISPGLWHRFPPFQWWLTREEAAAFPLENENGSTRLGLVGTLGFLVLLGLLFAPRAADRLAHDGTLLAASRLTLAAVLLATVGGFGSLFSLLVSPEIRAYNRISPFIVFFSLTAVALAVDSLARTPSRRLAAAIVIGLVGLADQRAAAVNLNAIHHAISAEVTSLRGVIADIETRLPTGAMVFQLPIRPYLNEDGADRMQPYEHFKPYLVSRTLRWSYPALTNQQVRWQQAAALVAPARLARELASAGFAAIMIDRTGYADGGSAVLAALQDSGRGARTMTETPRYLVLDVRHLALAPTESSVLARAAGSAPVTAGLAACAGPPLLYLERVGGDTPPFESPIRIDDSDTFEVSGWAVDETAQASAGGVDIVLDGTAFQTIYGTERSDVAAHYARPGYVQSGFMTAIEAERIGRGGHQLTIRVAAADGRCYFQTPPLNVLVD